MGPGEGADGQLGGPGADGPEPRPGGAVGADHAVAGIDLEAPGRGGGFPAHGGGPAGDEVPQQRVRGVDQGCLGQEGVQQRVGRDVGAGGAAGGEPARGLLGPHLHPRAQEAHHAGALEREQLVEAVRGRAGVYEAEQRVPPARIVALRSRAQARGGQLVHEHPVQAQQQLEQGPGGGGVAAGAGVEIGLDVAHHGIAGDLWMRLPLEPGQRVVEPCQRVLPRGGGGGARHPAADLGGDQRHHVGPEVEAPLRVLAGAQVLGRDVHEVARAGRGALVAHLGVVRHAAAGAHPEPRLAPGGPVAQPVGVSRQRCGLEHAAAPLGEQGHEVDEGQPHAAHDDVLPRGEEVQLRVGGL